jgi:hypothetical protein
VLRHSKHPLPVGRGHPAHNFWVRQFDPALHAEADPARTSKDAIQPGSMSKTVPTGLPAMAVLSLSMFYI